MYSIAPPCSVTFRRSFDIATAWICYLRIDEDGPRLIYTQIRWNYTMFIITHLCLSLRGRCWGWSPSADEIITYPFWEGLITIVSIMREQTQLHRQRQRECQTMPPYCKARKQATYVAVCPRGQAQVTVTVSYTYPYAYTTTRIIYPSNKRRPNFSGRAKTFL